MSNHINIKKEFIEKEMPYAPPIYVCVYLMTETYPKASAKEIAERMNILESDVLKAWKYWDEKNLFTKPEVAMMRSFTNQNRPIIKQIKINSLVDHSEKEMENETENKVLELPEIKETKSETIRIISLDQKPMYTPEELNQYIKHEALKKLIDDIHRKIAKPLSHQDISTIFSFYDWLGLPIEVIQLLFSYCSEDGFKGMRYVEKVAISWADLHLRTVDSVMDHIELHKTGNKAIMKAFGLHRTPIEVEEVFIKKWLKSLEFPLDVVLKACEKTVLTTGNVSFPYTDKILQGWKKEGVRSIKDIEMVDNSYKEKKKVTKTAPINKQEVSKKQDKFINFTQREWDFDALEKLQSEERNNW